MHEEKNLTHEDFVKGIKNGTINFEVMDTHRLVKLFNNPFQDSIMSILLILLFVPVFAIPILCYKFDKWILLLGFLGSFLGWVVHGFSMNTRKPIRSLVFITISFSILTTIMIYYFGYLYLPTFIVSCVFYQFFFFNFSGKLDDIIAEKYLTSSSDIYYSALKNSYIKTF